MDADGLRLLGAPPSVVDQMRAEIARVKGFFALTCGVCGACAPQDGGVAAFLLASMVCNASLRRRMLKNFTLSPGEVVQGGCDAVKQYYTHVRHGSDNQYGASSSRTVIVNVARRMGEPQLEEFGTNQILWLPMTEQHKQKSSETYLACYGDMLLQVLRSDGVVVCSCMEGLHRSVEFADQLVAMCRRCEPWRSQHAGAEGDAGGGDGVGLPALANAPLGSVVGASDALTEEDEGEAPLPPLAPLPLPPTSPPPSSPPGPCGRGDSRAQRGCFQDLRALQYHGWKWGGTYLEIGVFDALVDNNTILLEERYGWRGVCVDPLAQQIGARASTCVWFPVALASRTGTACFSMGGPLSGLTTFVASEVHNRRWHERAPDMPTVNVPTRTPAEVLAAAGMPRVIDYLSLDVEGAEMEVLRAFPWHTHEVSFATIETNDDAEKEAEMRAFMAERGYTWLGHYGPDDYYAYRPTRVPAFDPPLTSRRQRNLAKRIAKETRDAPVDVHDESAEAT